MTAKPQARNFNRLALAFADTSLTLDPAGIQTDETDVCWADPADHSKVWPFGFFLHKALPANPLFFTAFSICAVQSIIVELVLVDSAGTEIGGFRWDNPIHPEEINTRLDSPAHYYDDILWPQPNPLLMASGAKLRATVRIVGGMPVDPISLTVPSPFVVLLPRCDKSAKIILDGEQPFNLGWNYSTDYAFTDDHTPANYSFASYFWTGQVPWIFANIPEGIWYPRRLYKTWALALRGPVPTGMMQVYARGTIDSAGTLNVVWADSHFDATTKVLTNPLPSGYSGRALRFGLFVF